MKYIKFAIFSICTFACVLSPNTPLRAAFAVIALAVALTLLRDPKPRNDQNKDIFDLLDVAPFAMYTKAPDGTILFANKYFKNLVRQNPLGLCAYDILNNPDVLKNEDETILKNGEIITYKRVFALSDSASWFVMKIPVFNSDRKISKIAVFARNIDKELLLDDKKNSFVAAMTHDLKNPTLAQQKVAELLLEGTFGPLTGSQHDAVLEIKNSCEYMRSLIFTILDSWLYDNGSIKIVRKPFSIRDTVNSVITENQKLATEKSIAFEPSVTNIPANGDQLQLKRAVGNLVSNAVACGKPRSVVKISADINDNLLTLSVSGFSRFLPKNILNTVFDKYKDKSALKSVKTSTGLGLYIVKQIVESHGGKVFAQSLENGFTTFGFTIPQNVPDPSVIQKCSF